jgi:putative transposase
VGLLAWTRSGSWPIDQDPLQTVVDPGNRSRVNESLQPARLGRRLDHETHQTHSRADHPQSLARRASAKQWTAEQLIAQGKTVADVCRVNEETQPTYHRWRQQYGGLQAEEARRLNQLEKENARLKKLLAEARLTERSETAGASG